TRSGAGPTREARLDFVRRTADTNPVVPVARWVVGGWRRVGMPGVSVRRVTPHEREHPPWSLGERRHVRQVLAKMLRNSIRPLDFGEVGGRDRSGAAPLQVEGNGIPALRSRERQAVATRSLWAP